MVMIIFLFWNFFSKFCNKISFVILILLDKYGSSLLAETWSQWFSLLSLKKLHVKNLGEIRHYSNISRNPSKLHLVRTKHFQKN